MDGAGECNEFNPAEQAHVSITIVWREHRAEVH